MNAASTGTFSNGEYAVGQTSNAYAKIYTQANTTTVLYTYRNKPITTELEVGETIVGQSSGATGVISTITLGDWDNEYIPTSNAVTAVYRALQYSGGVGGERGTALFSTTFPLIANDIMALGAGSSDMVSYFLTKSHLEMLHDLLIGDINVRFNRHVNRIYLDVNWGTKFQVGDWVVLEAQQTIDPDTYSEIWSDRFVRDYATALVKKQWGQNLIKFDGVPMPGGITLNGKQLYEEGAKEAKELEDTIQSKYETPPRFFIG